jgi:hypothetical protein
VNEHRSRSDGLHRIVRASLSNKLVMRKGAQGVIDGAGRTNAWVNMAFGIW